MNLDGKMNLDGIPQSVIDFVQSEMDFFECSDNMRICEVQPTMRKTTEDYEKARARGCCGSCDYQVFHYQGKDYMYGFNFGH